MKKGQRTRSFRVADNLKPVAKSLKFNKPSYTVGSLFKTERMKNAVVEQVIKVKLLMDNACIIIIIVVFFTLRMLKKRSEACPQRNLFFVYLKSASWSLLT